MQYKVEIFHPNLTSVKIIRDGKILQEELCSGSATFSIMADLEVLSIWFEPWKIKPNLRINDIMINYALAQVDQFDHKLDIKLKDDFMQQYHRTDIDFRIKTVFEGKEIDDYVFDSVIGYGQMHKDILEQIKLLINEKK